ncbi:hypothetical protein PHET_05692 [Paragonimus heterotremus]|uniref:TOG domain-containing protein n=1 Tax=Paragonimus heterotremus TaxID=100268 RepID=A0A8J4SNM6_9TREM|nr:hypothetical protein PHET_05692 [Paragonimus heterotremus]
MSAASSSELDDALLMKLESNKWQERSDVLDVIGKHILSATLQSNSHNIIVRSLLQVIGSDKHTQLVTRAANMLQQFAERLGSSFGTYAERCLSVCLTKFKDNNRNVVQALRHATRAVLETMPLELGTTQVLVGMSHSSASIQAEATELLAHCLCLHSPHGPFPDRLNSAQRIRHVKPLLPVLHSLCQHRTSACREAGCLAFASVQLFLDDNPQQFESLIEGMLDEQRRIKVAVCLDTLRTATYERTKKSKNVGHTSVGPPVDRRKQKKDSKSKKTSTAGVDASTLEPIATSPPKSHCRRPPLRERQNQPDSMQRPNSDKECGNSKPSKNSRSIGKSNRQVSVVSDAPVSSYDTLDDLSDYFVTVPIDQLKDADWKVRLVVVESIKSRLVSHPPSGEVLVQIVSFILKSERLQDVNLQVRCTILSVLLIIARRLRALHTQLPDRILPALCGSLVSNLGDKKTHKCAQEALSLLFCCSDPGVSLACLCSPTLELKKPAAHAALLEWLALTLKQMDLKFDLSVMTQMIKQGLASVNPNVRASAISLAGSVHVSSCNKQDRLRSLLENEKPAILVRLEEEFTRCEEEALDLRRTHGAERLFSSNSDTDGSSLGTGSSSVPKLADATFARGSGDVAVNRQHRDNGRTSLESFELREDSRASGDQTDRWSETTPTKGVIRAMPPRLQPPHSLTPSLFFVEPNQTAALMEAKQIRLSQLNKTLCIDLDRLRNMFSELHANPQLVQCLFAPDVDSRLEALDKLTASLDEAAIADSDPSALILTYAHFDLLLAWTIGACFAYGSACEPAYQATLPSLTDSRALISRGLQYLTVVIHLFAQAEFQLSDQEVDLLLHACLAEQAPSLRSGLARRAAQPTLSDAISDLIRLLRQVYPASLLMDRIASLLHQCSSAAGRLSKLTMSVCGLTMLLYALIVTGRQLLEQHLGVKFSDLPSHSTNSPLLCTTPRTRTDAHTLEPSQMLSHLGPGTEPRFSSFRDHSPPPEHSSPAALAILLPLLRERNSTAVSAATRAAAAEQLDFALTCLVNQLTVRSRDGVDDAGGDVELDADTSDETEVLDNAILGALVDLETLILNPETCALLVPFVQRVVERLSVLAHVLSHTDCFTAGHKVFLDCLVSNLIVLFEQPFLAREVNSDSLVVLLASVFLLAQCDKPLTEHVRQLCNQRSPIVLRLVHLILIRVDATLAFRLAIAQIRFVRTPDAFKNLDAHCPILVFPIYTGPDSADLKRMILQETSMSCSTVYHIYAIPCSS